MIAILAVTSTGAGSICLAARQTALESSVRDLLADYSAGKHDSVSAQLRTLVGPGATWPLERFKDSLARESAQATRNRTTAGDRPRLLAAALALEAAAVADVRTDRSEIVNLVEWGCELLRRTRTASPAERHWHRGALVLLQARGWAEPAEVHTSHALRRFPDDGRFLLARAAAAELRTFPDPRDGRRLTERNRPLAEIIMARLMEAAKHEPVRVEAEVRMGFVLYRIGDLERGLIHLRSASDSAADPSLRYLAHLFSGRTLDRLGRSDEAIAAYQHAVDAVPSGQTAGLALAAALAKRGARSDAARAAAASLSRQPPVVDPWITYGQGEIRLWVQIIDDLRQALQSLR